MHCILCNAIAMDNIHTKFRQAIKSELKRQKLSYAGLFLKSGVNQSVISRYLDGSMEMTEANIDKVMSALGLSCKITVEIGPLRKKS